MRLFFAIEIDPALKNQLRRFVEEFRTYAAEARWSTPESWHITLKFVGEVSRSKADEIKAMFTDLSFPSFRIELAAPGFFPSPKDASVFCLGVDGGKLLPALAEFLDSTTEKAGIAREVRPYSPHITLARAPRNPRSKCFRELQAIVTQNFKYNFGTMTTREFFLYHSQLSPAGAEYSKIAHFELK